MRPICFSNFSQTGRWMGAFVFVSDRRRKMKWKCVFEIYVDSIELFVFLVFVSITRFAVTVKGTTLQLVSFHYRSFFSFYFSTFDFVGGFGFFFYAVFVLLLDFSLTTNIRLLGGVSFSTWRLNVIWMTGISLRTQNGRSSLIGFIHYKTKPKKKKNGNSWNVRWQVRSSFVLCHEQGQQAIWLTKRDVS